MTYYKVTRDGRKPFLKQNITQLLICVKNVVETGNILRINWNCKIDCNTNHEMEG